MLTGRDGKDSVMKCGRIRDPRPVLVDEPQRGGMFVGRSSRVPLGPLQEGAEPAVCGVESDLTVPVGTSSRSAMSASSRSM